MSRPGTFRSHETIVGRYAVVSLPSMVDVDDSVALFSHVQNGAAQAYAVHMFMLQLVLNHTIVVETLRDEVRVPAL